MDRAGFQEVHFPALLPREPYEATGRWDRLRRQHVPAAGPAGQRLPARPDPRGDVHAARQGPVLVVQGPAAVHLPDPDEVPRRGPAPRRPAARPRVRDEGLVQLRHRRCRVASGRTSATATPTSRTFDRLGLPYVIVSAMSGAMGGSASEEFLAPLEVGEDTFVRTHVGQLRRQRGGGARARATPTSPTTTLPPAVVHDTPGTPTIATLVDHLNGRDDLRRAGPPVDGGGHAEERRRQAAPPRRHRRAAGHRRARRPRRRHEAARGPGRPRRARAVRRRRLRPPPGARQGIHRAGRPGRRQRRRGSATWSIPGWSPARAG